MWFTESQSPNLKVSYKVFERIHKSLTRYQKIEVFKTVDQGRMLIIDGYVMLTERLEFVYHEMLSHVSIYSHPSPKSVLIIGGGDGGTARECLKHKNLRVTLCEIDQGVIEVSKKFFPKLSSCFKSPRLRVVIQDGFDFLYETSKIEKYDIILIDATDPIGEAAKLYSTEFYALVKAALKKGGIMTTIGSTPFYESKLISHINKSAEKVFSNVHNYLCFEPMYQSGCWSFIMASDRKISLSRYIGHNESHVPCDYFNEGIYKACFALPNFVKKDLSLAK